MAMGRRSSILITCVLALAVPLLAYLWSISWLRLRILAGGIISGAIAASSLSRGSRDASEMELESWSGVECTMTWMNSFIDFIWPRVDAWLVELLRNKVGPKIANALPRATRSSVRFVNVTLGNERPVFGPLRTSKTVDGNLEMTIGLNWKSACDIELKVGPALIKIQSLRLKANLLVVFVTQPPKPSPPFMRALRISCLTTPVLETQFGGVAGFPGLQGIVHDAILHTLENKMVVPNCIGVDMDDSDELDSTDLSCRAPCGIIRLTLYRAMDLVAADTNLLQAGTSDPYVKVRVGVQKWQSTTVYKNLNPVWSSGNVADFIVYDWDMPCMIQVWDEDSIGSDDLIGIAHEIPLQDLRTNGAQIEVPLDDPAQDSSHSSSGKTNQKVASGGRLVISGEAIGFTDSIIDRPPSETNPSSVCIFVKISRAIINSSEWKPPYANSVHVVDAENNELTAKHHSKSSFAVPDPVLAEEIIGVLKEMLKRDRSTDEIAEALNIQTRVVENEKRKIRDPARAAVDLKKDLEKRAQREPEFDQVLHLLVKGFDGTLLIEMKDSADKVVGVAEVPLENIYSSQISRAGGSEMQLSGSFPLRRQDSTLFGNDAGQIFLTLTAKPLQVAGGGTVRKFNRVNSTEVRSKSVSRRTKALKQQDHPGCFSFLNHKRARDDAGS